ncbi:putative zinc transporter msc2 [Pleurotus ostreatus]|uniref:Putative zinc transporter msc2 n=1 Tax=Pleurotus ostreatus TaxID=5322 RepID=A0A8H6ZTU1_PLEOS|nr:putative zinc transporter msc2 [Pleurotus ostreatus]KAF7430574.1 putative zinc transporter msc2 [Pleurotus ostreatus]
MPAPDARTRSKIPLNPTRVFSSSIPRALLPQVLGSNLLLAGVVYLGKEWLLSQDVGMFWVVMRLLACGGLGILVWEGITGQMRARKHIEFSVLAMASLLLFVQQISFFTALYRMSAIRVVILTHFAPYWTQALLGGSTQSFAAIVTLAIAFLSDIQFSFANIWHFLPPYGALIVYAIVSTALEHTHSVLSPSLGTTVTLNASTLGAAFIALPLYGFRTVLLGFPTTPVIPLSSLAILPLLTISLLFVTPTTTRAVGLAASAAHYVSFSYPVVALSTTLFGILAFSRLPSWSDILTASVLYYAVYPLGQDALMPTSRTPTSRLIRSYLKTILSNPESRKIFYFLMLNMCYMLVQMLYGVWTNSLGLISDAIHMAFDCMAIGVGLLASVMATWEPNVRFTYGYGRIETLSGFANGIFLILISIFIVFEAIQRLLDPPEMNTSQLLLVSSLGLAVNLFGMFAMGGHHHPRSHTHSSRQSDHASKTHRRHDSEKRRPPPLQGLVDLSAPESLLSPISPIGRVDQSPVTPQYHFGADDHYQKHHQNDTPNLNNHNHAPDHSHEGHSHNMRGVFLHVMADTLGSVGVIISTLLIQFYGWTGFDPIASLFIAIMIAASVIPLVLDTGRVLCLDVADRDTDIQHALSELASVEGLASYTSARFWPKDASSLIGSIHIQLSPSAATYDPAGPHSSQRTTYMNLDRVVERVDTLLKKRIRGLEELTIQVGEPAFN